MLCHISPVHLKSGQILSLLENLHRLPLPTEYNSKPLSMPKDSDLVFFFLFFPVVLSDFILFFSHILHLGSFFFPSATYLTFNCSTSFFQAKILYELTSPLSLTTISMLMVSYRTEIVAITSFSLCCPYFSFRL